MSPSLPPISVLIPTFNEENFIKECLFSLVNGNYPTNLLEIIVIDGGSNDNTVEYIKTLSKSHTFIKCLHNPKKIVPSSMNIGLKKAKNDIVIRADAHALYDENYLVQSVLTLLEENCASVGGVITPIAKTVTGKAIAVATTSKFGIGNAKYRYAKKRQSVDTVFAGCWKKQNVEKIGGFNENWVRNQDYELNCRLRAEIGKIILNPNIKCQYYCRETIPSLFKQYFSYGFWRFYTFRQHPSSFTVRQAAPLLLLLGLIVSTLLCLYSVKLGLVIPATYVCANIIASLQLSLKNKNLKLLGLLPIIFMTLHLSWALGFTKSAIQSAFKNIKNQ